MEIPTGGFSLESLLFVPASAVHGYGYGYGCRSSALAGPPATRVNKEALLEQRIFVYRTSRMPLYRED